MTNQASFTDSMGNAHTGTILATSPTHLKVEVIINGHPWVDWIPRHRFQSGRL